MKHSVSLYYNEGVGTLDGSLHQRGARRGRFGSLKDAETVYLPLPPPVMTTTKPLAEKSSEGFKGTWTSMFVDFGCRAHQKLVVQEVFTLQSTLCRHMLSVPIAPRMILQRILALGELLHLVI